MSVYPVSQALIAPDWTRDPPITPRLLIFHTAVSNAAAPGPSAPGSSGLEWHFYIAEDGEIVQRRDTGEEADANYHANSFFLPRDGTRYGAISVETWDGGDPEGNPWTAAQVDSMVRLCHLANGLDGIPLVRPEAWTGAGVGYHREHDEWNQPYHSCPGNTRAAQFDSVIWPLVLQGDDMPTAAEIASAVWGTGITSNAGDGDKEYKAYELLNFVTRDAHTAAVYASALSDPAKFAAAVASRIPGVTQDQLEQAFSDVLKQGVG